MEVLEIERTELVLLPARVNELARGEASVASVGEHARRLVEGTAKARTDRKQTRCKGGNEVLARTGRNDCVHGAGTREVSKRNSIHS